MMNYPMDLATTNLPSKYPSDALDDSIYFQ